MFDGREPGYFNYYWLRDNCPTSFDRKTRERIFDIFHLTAPPRPETVRVEEDVLVIIWKGEGHVSRYPLTMTYKSPRPLAEFCHGLIEASFGKFGETASIERADRNEDGLTVADFRIKLGSE